MANPDISLLNATYSGVTGVTLPKSGGGTATFPWVEGSQTITTNNTYDVTNLAQVVVNVSGGGGASNVVTGTFKGTTTGAAMDVTLNYTGSGYPIAVLIYPSYTDLTTFSNTIQRYAIRDFMVDKMDRANVPTFNGSGNKNSGYATSKYKSSTSAASSYSAGGGTGATATYDDVSAEAGAATAVKIRSAKKMSVYIASSSYGFMANIEYTYWVIYSS